MVKSEKNSGPGKTDRLLNSNGLLKADRLGNSSRLKKNDRTEKIVRD